MIYDVNYTHILRYIIINISFLQFFARLKYLICSNVYNPFGIYFLFFFFQKNNKYLMNIISKE